MLPTITAFRASPDRGRGLARDMRVRWALEELGLAYDVRLLDFAELREDTHLALNPFGQIPTFEHDGLALFETGAIVLHLAQAYEGLLPEQPLARARAINWIFAALSTVEPPILELESALLVEGRQPWTAQRRPLIEKRINRVFDALARRLGQGPWIDGAFSAGDLMLVSVLIRARSPGLLAQHPLLADYVARAEARPAHVRAFRAQHDVYLASLT